ncbi:complement C1q-like protein 3 [Cheilinus undulatus]|uniref:complement C1q-like protein 3 n=1 Tax=Cheilinus undulatus TaxID=241271 RepID=UPI001BD56832|nr:complement C1q-like protein 3 [Cheilinus undulatus]
MLWLLLLFCGLTLAQDDSSPAETSSCSPACELMKEFGAIKEKVNALETRLSDAETRLDDSEKKTRELENREHYQVIFTTATGGGGARIGPFETATPLIYRTVITNIGNGYNETTGVFTAPVAGVYYFSFSYHAGGAHGTRLALLKNSETIVMSGDQKSTADKTDNGGNTAFLLLQPGDRVFVRLAENTQVWGSDYHTTFSGCLVTQM